jgi:hypothetical protein
MVCPHPAALNPAAILALYASTSPHAPIPRSGFVLRPVLAVPRRRSSIFGMAGVQLKTAVRCTTLNHGKVSIRVILTSIRMANRCEILHRLPGRLPAGTSPQNQAPIHMVNVTGGAPPFAHRHQPGI